MASETSTAAPSGQGTYNEKSPEGQSINFTKYPSLRKIMDVESHDGREVKLLKYIYDHPKLDSELRGSPTAILAIMDEFAAQEHFLINIGSDKAKILGNFIHEHKPKVFLELGTYVGYSTILFANAMREANQEGEKLHLYSLELDPLIGSIAMNLVNLAGLSDIVEVIVGSSAHTLQRLHDQGTLEKGSIDIIFLDHAEKLYKPDLELCEKLGFVDKKGCHVIADNVVRPGAPEYREYARRNPRFSDSWGVPTLIMPGEFGDEIEISRVA
ncbi:hypothetical protein DPV78_007939 [Talaromyces pinophilus]|nr:hypothetical protein DPV78_007939 [Talaromyces pinophilus]